MNEEKDEVGGLLVQLADEGKISYKAAGLTGDTVMPAMPQEQTANIEATALPTMPEEGEVEPEIGEMPETVAVDPFWIDIAESAENWHGGTPTKTRDAAEAETDKSKKSSDIGFGHKIKDSEWESGYIHGIRFIDDNGNFIPLTREQGLEILQKDVEENVRIARDINWDNYLKSIGSSWEELDPRYQKALGSLAFNVGGTKAGNKWKRVLQAAANQNVQQFAKEMRRRDNKKHTAGMDNRVAKELYYAGIIDSFEEVASVLPLATARVAGVPETKDV